MISTSIVLAFAAVAHAVPTLVGRSVLQAESFLPGVTSGKYIVPNGGVQVPFINKQPVQGFSGVIPLFDDGETFLNLEDNGYGSIETSDDFELRIIKTKSNWRNATSGTGDVEVLGYIGLADPDRKVPFAITNEFTSSRLLTGSDFDPESIVRANDGTLWIGEEFGPFLLHFSADGKLLEAPYILPDFNLTNLPGPDVRSPQSPFNEESSAIRVLNAHRAHAFSFGAKVSPVFSPTYVNLKYTGSNPNADPSRNGTGAASDVHSISLLNAAGYRIVTWTVNDKAKILELLAAGVQGIISDDPSLLYQALKEFDANKDGTPGDYLNADGLTNVTRFDAQGHRGGRALRPENTLPAFEVSMDNLMATIETDTGVTKDGKLVISHNPTVEPTVCRRKDGGAWPSTPILIKNFTLAEIQSTYICDVQPAAFPTQKNDTSLSPVAVAFAAAKGLAHPYIMPTPELLFDFVKFYKEYYTTGAGSSAPDAVKRAKTAEKARFNIETKVFPTNPDATVAPAPFAELLASVIVANGMTDRATIQSFDFRTLKYVQEKYPSIQTVYLMSDGTMKPTGPNNANEWMNGLYWPYRVTVSTNPSKIPRSNGFEGMGSSVDKKVLYPLLEGTLAGEPAGTLRIHEFDTVAKKYTGKTFTYRLEANGTNIGDFYMYNDNQGLVLERNGAQGVIAGSFKQVFQIDMNITVGGPVQKKLLIDEMNIADPDGISSRGTNLVPVQQGDLGLGNPYAMPFNTIEGVYVLDAYTVLITMDNNYPFSIGRHVGSQKIDDNEFVKIRLDAPLNVAVPPKPSTTVATATATKTVSVDGSSASSTPCTTTTATPPTSEPGYPTRSGTYTDVISGTPGASDAASTPCDESTVATTPTPGAYETAPQVNGEDAPSTPCAHESDGTPSALEGGDSTPTGYGDESTPSHNAQYLSSGSQSVANTVVIGASIAGAVAGCALLVGGVVAYRMRSAKKQSATSA
ncbi:hypothetical protein BJ742DRAFT_832421 [Cladochytrium replicatum]|nr:hypothetical protein BJ742DRAFT_832421 [Cladochytrium replicatum]